MILLDLQTCRAGYSPTHFQRDLFPDRVQVQDRRYLRRRRHRGLLSTADVARQIAGREIPASTRDRDVRQPGVRVDARV